MTLQQLLKQLAANQIDSIYLILGDDVPARQRAVQALRSQVCAGELEGWNYHEIDGEGASGGQIVAMAQTLPFLGERRLVVVRSFDRMPAEEQQALQPLLDSPPGHCVLVLVAATLDRRTKMAKELLAKVSVVDVSAPKPEALGAWVRAAAARERGLALSAAAADALLGMAGSDTGFLAQELDKLAVALAAGQGRGGPVVAEVGDVLPLAARGERELAAFAGLRLAEVVAGGQTQQALRQLGELLAAGEAPLRIVGVLAYQYRLLLGAKAYAAAGPQAAANALGVSLFPMQKAFAAAKHLTDATIAAGLEEILAADLAMKRGCDPARQLQVLVVRMCAAARSR